MKSLDCSMPLVRIVPNELSRDASSAVINSTYSRTDGSIDLFSYNIVIQ